MVQSEVVFQRFLSMLLCRLGAEVQLEVRLGSRWRADMIARLDGQDYLIEVKNITPHTTRRFHEAIGRVRQYGAALKESRGISANLVIAIPGVISEKDNKFLDVSIWDRGWIIEKARLVGLTKDAEQLFTGEPRSETKKICEDLADELASTSPGLEHWRKYQDLCRKIFDFLFSPPLESSLGEKWNETGTNRRDFILPNYCMEGFWGFLRVNYSADYPVFDAKNYKGEVGKEDVLQVAHYLTGKGLGLFGGIITRSGGSVSANIVIREQWILHSKMILIFSDEDLKQMLASKSSGESPSALVRQKIEDFRLAI